MKRSNISKLSLATLLQIAAAQDPGCLCLPGDACWPKADAWSSLNSTVKGNLVATVPIGSPCHDPTFNQAACDQLKADWTNPLIQ